MALVGVTELEYNILMHLNARELYQVCRINTSMVDICHNKWFWFKKFKMEGLKIPMVTLTDENNWIAIYNILININRFYKQLTKYCGQQFKLNPYYKLDDYLSLFKNLDIDVDTPLYDDDQLTGLILFKNKIELQINKTHHFQIKITYDQFYNLLYHLAYYEYIYRPIKTIYDFKI